MNQKSTSRVAVITGATGGIGAAVAKALSEAGYRLVLSGRSEQKLAAVASGLPSQSISVPGDLCDPSLATALLSAALNNFGRCDICFNNGGILETGLIATIDIDRVCEMVRVNVEAAFRIAYVFVRHFAQQNSGHLVNTSSVLGTKVRPTAGAYAGTKFAIEALSEALRIELAKTNIRNLLDRARTRPHRAARSLGGSALAIDGNS